MHEKDLAKWMLDKLGEDGCLYQEDVVDHLLRIEAEDLLRENGQGNLVLSKQLLIEFRKISEPDIVWVQRDRYWRFRVDEDESGRASRE